MTLDYTVLLHAINDSPLSEGVKLELSDNVYANLHEYGTLVKKAQTKKDYANSVFSSGSSLDFERETTDDIFERMIPVLHKANVPGDDGKALRSNIYRALGGNNFQKGDVLELESVAGSSKLPVSPRGVYSRATQIEYGAPKTVEKDRTLQAGDVLELESIAGSNAPRLDADSLRSLSAQKDYDSKKDVTLSKKVDELLDSIVEERVSAIFENYFPSK